MHTVRTLAADRGSWIEYPIPTRRVGLGLYNNALGYGYRMVRGVVRIQCAHGSSRVLHNANAPSLRNYFRRILVINCDPPYFLQVLPLFLHLVATRVGRRAFSFVCRFFVEIVSRTFLVVQKWVTLLRARKSSSRDAPNATLWML